MIVRAELMLVLLAQQGDREALNSLLAQVEPRLLRYIRGILSSDANSAEDVLQETLLRIVRKLGWLTEPHAFEAWIYRIASNEAYRALKRAHRRLREEELDEALPVPGPIVSRLETEELEAMIGDLSPASRAVVLLHYQEEQPLEEIATILSIPLGTVKSRLAYGLKCLRERVKR
jgi:RNA polymerase sigma-70 factor (ECF subfamily)